MSDQPSAGSSGVEQMKGAAYGPPLRVSRGDGAQPTVTDLAGVRP